MPPPAPYALLRRTSSAVQSAITPERDTIVDRKRQSVGRQSVGRRSAVPVVRPPPVHRLLDADSWAWPGASPPNGASHLTSLAAGFGLRQATVGHSAHFVLLAHQADGRAIHSAGLAHWEVRVIGPGKTMVGLVEHEDGLTTVRFTCDCSGKHRIAIRIGTDHLAGSPFTTGV